MGKRHRGGCQNFTEQYWQGAAINQRTYYSFLNQITSLALSRFTWHNLPATCDERYLEWTLLYEGKATIAFWKKVPGVFYSTQAVQKGAPNVYQNPSRWESFGVNGWRFPVDNSNGVFVYDNLTRYPLYPQLEMFARELTDVYSCMRVNRQHVKTPYILTGPQERKLDMTNIYKQIAGGEPAVIATEGFKDIDIQAIQTEVPYLGKELYETVQNIWQQVYDCLGISHIPYKSERQIEDEVRSMKEPSQLAAMAALKTRRKACEELNARFGEYLDRPISVTWTRDFETEANDRSFDAHFPKIGEVDPSDNSKL